MTIPRITIPGIDPTGECCLFRINKRFDGGGSGEAGTSYQCRTGPTSRGTTKFAWRIFSQGAPTCDESTDLLPDSVLNAGGAFIQRHDDFAHFIGRFAIARPLPAPPVTFFTGYIELLFRSGSHQHLSGIVAGEKCNQEKHLEGWLLGRGQASLSTFTLRASIVGEATLPGVFAPVAELNRITGTLVSCP